MGIVEKLRRLFRVKSQSVGLIDKNGKRFDSIISDIRFNYLECTYEKLFTEDTTLSDAEIIESYFKFSDCIQTNTFAAAELEWVVISVICYFRPSLTEIIFRRGLLSIVYSLGEDIDSFTVLQFIEVRILTDEAEPYGGLPPAIGLKWLTDILPMQKETIQMVLDDVIKENRRELEDI
ncbi:MAG: hypothetical protein EOO57_07440 [Hymenobacter sp.]|nr:MAG: hypothetical protein EOO57_07440 [Hymenobacter sp.]